MAPRTVGLIGALCLLTGWLMGSLVLPPVASSQSNPSVERPAPVPVDTGAAPAYAERLRQKLREAPAAPTSRRNPFTFDQPRATSPARSAAAAEAWTPPPPPVETPPAFDLAGIATTDAADGAVRTAVISTRGDVVLARVGDVLPDGTRIVSIDDTTVTLDAGGRSVILRLK